MWLLPHVVVLYGCLDANIKNGNLLFLGIAAKFDNYTIQMFKIFSIFSALFRLCVCIDVCISVFLHIYSQTRGKGMCHVKYNNPSANLPT